MQYSEYFRKFNANDEEDVVQYISNEKAEEFLLKNAPRLYCPDSTIEETFAFRTWTMRKHIKKTDVGFLLTVFLPDVPWAAKYNTINAPLTHHLNEFRWLKNADDFLDYINFFINGDRSVNGAFVYHTPALTAMYQYCIVTANEEFLRNNAEAFERYFQEWELRHGTPNGLYWSQDNYEGTEFSIGGTTSDKVVLKGFRPLFNSCMYGDALSLSKIYAMVGNVEKSELYAKKAENIKRAVNEKLWDGTFFKAIHPYHQDFNKEITYKDIPEECNARELMGYIPWAYNVVDAGRESVFALLKDSTVFKGKTGFTTADMSNKRFLFYTQPSCTWNGHVWPYATSYVINASIELLKHYKQNVISDKDLYDFIKQYAKMHYVSENGKIRNFIDESMEPFEFRWYTRERLKEEKVYNRGKDYNHSTFIDLVLRGLCGVVTESDNVTVVPRVKGIWKWFKIENLSYRKQSYTVYYDEDGCIFNKGTGVIIEKV